MSRGDEELPERAGLERLEELYERARRMSPAARASFLSEACRGNSPLEEELHSLLGYAAPAEAFFTGLSEAFVSPSTGHCVGHYRLVGILGSGGMGTVYRALDTRLERVVALKFLPPHLSTQPEARERLLVEARAAAALDHPNVCSIHEIGETADGRPFIAMACYDGETLKERLSRGPLPVPESAACAIQIARGLSAAHAHGIVHRDVKPGNIILCADGTVRLVDFGLAKVDDANPTSPGVTPGTVAYMSPEQARGDPVDHRTDLWSLGVVLYEMLSGVRPFRGGNDRAVIQAILHDEPMALPGPVCSAAPSMPGIVAHLLRKSPQERFGNADGLLSELARVASSGAFEEAVDRMRTRRRAIAVSGVCAVAALAVLALFQPIHRSRVLTPPDPAPRLPAIAVLPFTVHGPGLSLWREGIVDLLSVGLDGTGGIRAIDSRTMLARWHKEVGNTAVADLALALGVARRTGSRYALVGSVVAAGPQIRLSADIYDLEGSVVVGQVLAEGPSDSTFVLVDRLGMQTLAVIQGKGPREIPAVDIASVTTTSLLALKAYLEGEGHYRRSDFTAAIEAWTRAVRTDTLFALAHLRLAEAIAWSANYGSATRSAFLEALNRARLLAGRLPRRERTLVQIRWAREDGTPGTLSAIREAARLYPDAADMWYELGEVYHHEPAAMGDPEEAEGAFRRASELQPSIAPYRAHLLDLAFLWRPDSSRIAHELMAYGRLAPRDLRTRAGQVAFRLAFGRTDSGATSSALGELDPQAAARVYLLLSHPRFAEVRAAVFAALHQRSRVMVRSQRFKDLGLTEGRARYALETEVASASGALRYCGPLYLSSRGLPVPEQVMDETLTAIRADGSLFSSRSWVVCAAEYAARKGDWREHRVLVSRAREIAARQLAAGDTTSAGEWDWVVLAAEAHGLWRQGRKEESLRAFERTLQTEAGWSTLWHVGQLALDLGQVDQAERVFRALRNEDRTPAYLQLARLLDRTGRRNEAREAYQYVADAWRNADPEVQSLVEEARQAVARLSRAGDQVDTRRPLGRVSRPP